MAIEIVDFPSYKMVMFHNFPIAFCMFTRGYRALKEVVVDCGGFSYQTETLEARGSLAPWHPGREEGFFWEFLTIEKS